MLYKVIPVGLGPEGAESSLLFEDSDPRSSLVSLEFVSTPQERKSCSRDEGKAIAG